MSANGRFIVIGADRHELLHPLSQDRPVCDKPGTECRDHCSGRNADGVGGSRARVGLECRQQPVEFGLDEGVEAAGESAACACVCASVGLRVGQAVVGAFVLGVTLGKAHPHVKKNRTRSASDGLALTATEDFDTRTDDRWVRSRRSSRI